MSHNGLGSLLNRFGARLGLLALALQLVLSFGHFHPLPSQITAVSAPVSQGAPDLPLAGDDCAICASIAAFATLDMPRTDDLRVPGETIEILSAISVPREHHAAPIVHFSSRAPPAA